MAKSLNDFLEKIPESYRSKVILLEGFRGNRTNISFTFSCGCKVEQCLKAFLLRDNFDYCTKCKKDRKPKSIKFTCEYCLSEYIKAETFNKCMIDCKNKYNNLVLGDDYVICKICGFHGQNIGIHISKMHNLSSEEYISKYNASTTSEKSHDKYSKNTFRYLTHAKKNGIDLTEYKNKMSKSVREAILNNQEERKRRAEVMSKVNKSDVMRKKSSETAKKTSSRPEILKARSEVLARWRNNFPDKFQECVKHMLESWQSRPEKKLFQFVSTMPGFNFKKNQRVKSETFLSLTKEKQIDMADKEKRIYIEFDGIFHFKDVFNGKLAEVQNKDNLLDQHIIKHGWTLIRVSYDQFLYRTKKIDNKKIDASYFKQECLDKIIEILNSGIPGVYKIGEAYEQHKINN